MNTNSTGFTAVLWLLIFMFPGCQSSGSRESFFSSPLKVGDEVEVKRNIGVPAGLARIYLQYGKTGNYADTDQYTPFCYFVMQQPLPVEQTIRPGRFTISSVRLDETDVRLERPVRLAARIGLLGGHRTPIAFQFHMRLSSVEQPDVRTLVCSGAFATASTAAPIRLPQVQAAFGTLAEVRVRADSAAGQ